MELLSPLTAAATASASAAGGDGDESATIQTSSEGAEEPVQLKLPVTSAIAGKEETLIYKEHEVDIPDVVIDALGEGEYLLFFDQCPHCELTSFGGQPHACCRTCSAQARREPRSRAWSTCL